MSDFKVFGDAVHARYEQMAQGELFVVDVENIFDTYLAAFPAGSNPILRERTEHDCNCCKQFIRKLGVLVSVDAQGQTHSVWDDLQLPSPYKEVADRMSDVIRQAPIRTVWRTKERTYGTDHNYDAEWRRYDHFHGRVGDKHYSKEADTKRGEMEQIVQVMRRGLTEINKADLDTVLELIDSNALYRGEEHRAALVGFRDLLTAQRAGNENFVWANLHNRNARFRNTVIGTLLVDLAEGMALEDAVRKFEAKVAPQNYKRTTALITPRMVDEAVATLQELGLEGAIHRRMARLGDVSVNNVLFVDNSVRDVMKDGGVAALLASEVKPKAIGDRKATDVHAETFFKDILPGSTSLSVLVQNRHAGNFVTLTGGDGPERLFKWGNNFAWAYDGEVTDSIKQRVKKAGGNVNALLRVSLGWTNWDDLDIHCQDPRGNHIHYGNKMGILDVDMNAAGRQDSRTPVENLAFNHLMDGVYKVFVNNYLKKESIDVGFTVEVEYAGLVQEFNYPKAVANKQSVNVLLLHVENGRLMRIEASDVMQAGANSGEKWGVKTETLVPVTICCTSPNFWDGQAIGQQHWFFMLEGCRNPDPVRGIFNEFLRSDLEKHRKVFEILGGKTKCPPTEDQISGVGFSAARGDTVTVVVNGRRAFNIHF